MTTPRNIIRRALTLGATLPLMLTIICACKGKSTSTEAPAPQIENLMHEAQLLHLYNHGDFYEADVINPWDTTTVMRRYILVERGVTPDSLPQGDFVRVEIPLQRSLVYSSVHTGIIEEMGKASAIAGVCDGEYFKGDMAARIKRGEVKNMGNSVSPSLEAIVALNPDAILVSPFENAGHGVIEQIGTPIIECADYMENTPKGRAEWMRFFGLLYGSDKGDSIYSEVAQHYDALAHKASQATTSPIVLTEMLTDGYWFVPGGASYMAKIIEDAGGDYPWSTDTHNGSLQLDFSTVYAKAADADFWLVKSYGHDITLSDIESMSHLNGQFKAFKDGNVFVANTAVVPLYEEFPFHPEKLLEEYIKIFHPEIIAGETRYYKRANEK
jgi:iron complex transport system substrate-binding protein